MKDVGFGGKKKIAEILLHCSLGGLPAQRRPHPQGEADRSASRATPTSRRRPTTVRGDYPNHLWLVDITRIATLFPMLSLHLIVVLDAFSRLPLAATIRLSEPSAAVAISLLDRAIRTHGRPRHLVTDQGAQFTASGFRAFVSALSIRMRYGKVGESHSIGLIDRFFRTLKDSLSLRSIRPWNLRDVKRRLTAALIPYAYHRPHTSLGGLTPIEMYYGIRGHLPHAASPPRGTLGHPEADIPVDFVFLDPENRAFPVLTDKVA